MLFSDMNNNTLTKNNYSHCYGCGLCTLVCPIWHQNHDVSCTPHAHAKALQVKDNVNVIGLFDCILCGACEPVCPANIDIMQMMIKLRQENTICQPSLLKIKSLSTEKETNSVLFLADNALIENQNTKLLEQILSLLNTVGIGNVKQAADNADDIIKALKSGGAISSERLDEFLTPLKSAKKLIVSDGLLKTRLQQWLPNTDIMSLGYVLTKQPFAINKLSKNDLYVIESKAYNADFKNMVIHYHQIKQQSGCQFNLDLQRLAVPTGGLENNAHRKDTKTITPPFDSNKQSQWILQELKINRVVVESVEDGIVMKQVSDLPVIHLSELLSS